MKTEFYNEAFGEHDIPQNLKDASISICNTFNIKGICDPAYIVNVIAIETGLGDGQFNFNDPQTLRIDGIKRASERIAFSYGCNVDSAEGVRSILSATL